MWYTDDMKTNHEKERFIGQLLAWYDEHKRILPWRDDPSPYAIWVSEIMLQQTRVEAVKPYFHRFMAALPTLRDLAECEDEKLAKLWEGLGYYNRVRNMKKSAILCMEKYGGELPHSYVELLTLPGIGAYTAGAIASIAYREKVPAVDGNVLRVFSRILCSEDDIMKEATKKKFQMIIQEYLPDRCDAFNQALMEIGALICVPNGAPHCEICPVADQCMAYQSDQQLRLPIKQPKKKRVMEQKSILVIVYEGRVHLLQRPATGLLANLYQFDLVEGELNKTAACEYASKLGEIATILPLQKAKHIFTHKEWHMKGWLICLKSSKMDQDIWASQEEILQTYAIPTALKVYKEACLMALEGVIRFE